MIREELYKHLPATRFSKARIVKTRIEIWKKMPDGSVRNERSRRILSAEIFAIYKTAAAMDGVIANI
jgi:hypothetical protein